MELRQLIMDGIDPVDHHPVRIISALQAKTLNPPPNALFSAGEHNEADAQMLRQRRNVRLCGPMQVPTCPEDIHNSFTQHCQLVRAVLNKVRLQFCMFAQLQHAIPVASFYPRVVMIAVVPEIVTNWKPDLLTSHIHCGTSLLKDSFIMCI